MSQDQSVNPATQDLIVRNQDGTFAKGQSGNPTGNNGMKGLARWEIRVEQLSEKYPTMEDLMQFFIVNQEGAMVPSEALLKMNAIDAGIIRQLIGGVLGRNTTNERETFWNRWQGKPVETVHYRKVNKNENIPTTFETIEQAVEAFDEVRKAPQ